MARPSEYSPELIDLICDRIAAGESVRAICRDDDMPSEQSFYKWLLQGKEGLVEKYTRARATQADRMLEEILEIADDTRFDTEHTDQGPKPNAEWINRSKLRVDTRKWAMSKLAPKKYGDKLDITSDGEKVAPQFYILPDGSRVEF